MTYNVFGGTLSLTQSINQPVLLYGLQARPLTKSDLQSLDFVIIKFFMNLFRAISIETVKHCQEYVDFSIPSVLWAKCVASKFEVSFERVLSVLLQYICLI